MKLITKPFSENKIAEFKNKILTRSAQLQNVTLNFIPGTGVTSILSYLLRERQNIGEYTQNHLFILINVNKFNINSDQEIQRAVSIIQNMYSNDIAFRLDLSVYNVNDLNAFKNLIHELTFKHKYELTFMFTEAASLFFSKSTTLHELYEILKINPMLTSGVFFNIFEYDDADINRLGELASFFIQNIEYYNATDTYSLNAYVQNQVAFLSKTYNKTFINKLIDLCDTDAKTFKHAIDLANTEDDFDNKFLNSTNVYHLLNPDWLNTRFQAIVKNLKPASKSWLQTGKTNPTKFLLKTNFVTPINSTYQRFNKLFEEFIKNADLETTTRNVADTQLSGIEQLVLEFLLKNEGQIVSKTDIAKILWQNSWEEKYSEWAIDKFLSRLRSSLSSINYKKALKTVKGKGVILA